MADLYLDRSWPGYFWLRIILSRKLKFNQPVQLQIRTPHFAVSLFKLVLHSSLYMNGKFTCIWLITLSCYGSIPLSYGYLEGWWLEHSVSKLQVCLSVEVPKTFFGPCLSPLWRWGSLTIAFFGNNTYLHYLICLVYLHIYTIYINYTI